MDLKELLSESLVVIDNEIELLKEENNEIKGVQLLCKGNGNKRRVIKKTELIEARVRRKQVKLLNLLDLLETNLPKWKNKVSRNIEKFHLEILDSFLRIEEILPKDLFSNKGQVNWIDIEKEIQHMQKNGFNPLMKELEGIKKSIKSFSKKNKNIKLNQKDPFLLVFHSTNSFEQVKKILTQQKSFPKKKSGKSIEYALEMDLFWLKEKKDISLYFGHVLQGFTPRNRKDLLKLKRKKEGIRDSDPKNFLNRKGISKPEWIFPLLGKVKILIEIKSGRGVDTKALNKLIHLLKKYQWDDQVMFYGFSLWYLDYLKHRLPKSKILFICMRSPFSGRVIQFPLNHPIQSILKWGFMPKIKDLYFVDMYSNLTKNNQNSIMNQIKFYKDHNKQFFGGKANNENQLDWLLSSGAGGVIPWMSSKEVMNWVKKKN
jgi:hypothetical protein